MFSYLLEVCVFDPKYVALGSVKIYEVFPRYLLDVFRAVSGQRSVPLPCPGER